MKKSIYIFAYGSLVNDNSRNKTIEFAHPDIHYYAEISPRLGYSRVFNVRTIKNGIPQIMLGIEKLFQTYFYINFDNILKNFPNNSYFELLTALKKIIY